MKERPFLRRRGGNLPPGGNGVCMLPLIRDEAADGGPGGQEFLTVGHCQIHKIRGILCLVHQRTVLDAEVVDKSFPGFWEEIAPLLR